MQGTMIIIMGIGFVWRSCSPCCFDMQIGTKLECILRIHLAILIAAFQQENEAWAAIWRNNYREVERAMCTFRAMSRSDRADASRWLLNWHNTLARAGGGIPFRTEAEQFAEVYWRSRQ